MTRYYADDWLTVYQGDCREVMASMEPESVQCVVTSPPYWGLRDYGTATWIGGDPEHDHSFQSDAGSTSQRVGRTYQQGHAHRDCSCGAVREDGQLGLEPTPEAYVASMVEVFREVRRVLRDDGTLWLNLGDSYNAYNGNAGPSSDIDQSRSEQRPRLESGHGLRTKGLKPKDLVGIPWRVAFALQQPYYAGRIKSERDRAWLAAMIDGEGSIDVNRIRSTEGVTRKQESFGAYVRVHNTSEAIVRRCAEIAGVGSVNMTDGRRQPVFVWAVYGANAKMVLREVYPYLVGKQQQARLAAHPSDETCAGLRLLHHGRPTTVDRTAPESPLEPGWYLRSDIIWSKPNPMPESVTDRPTKSHEYLFLMSKSPRYRFDADAVRETAIWPDGPNSPESIKSPFGQGFTRSASRTWEQRKADGEPMRHGLSGAAANGASDVGPSGSRNIRSVWTIATQPYPGAHFATFPPKLVEPCVKAGCPSGGVVLDPFAGSGTTGMVAQALGRRAVLIDLNGEYLTQAMRRNQQSPLGLDVA